VEKCSPKVAESGMIIDEYATLKGHMEGTMKIQAVTISVSDLQSSKRFYEEVLGFEPDILYEKWQSYKSEESSLFGIIEVPDLIRPQTMDIINFTIPNVNSFWNEIKDKVEAEMSPTKTPWGSYKIVVLDPDGYRIGFVEGA
jgi:catechol 2,3-dioxygenase-like lactoylglutathione lyase family enzyme